MGLVIVLIPIALFLLFVFPPSFLWFGEKKALYKKLKAKTWVLESSNELFSTDHSLIIERSTRYGIFGSKYVSYYLKDANTNLVICYYQTITNPLSKIYNPFYFDFLDQRNKERKELLRRKIESL